MSCVTLTFEVWTLVKVTAHRLNEDNPRGGGLITI